MNKSLKSLLIAPIALAIGLVALPVDTRADGHFENMINARQGYYRVVLHNAGILFGMAKGDVEYDAAKAQTAADNLSKISSLDVSSMWAPGTSKEEMPGKTRALKKIWDTWPAIGEKSTAWKNAISDLTDVASMGLDDLRPKVGALGASCKGCHDEFRAENF